MTGKQLLKDLKSMGTAQNRKVYGRHGVTGEMYGVSYANLGKLTKKVKRDHDAALELWASGVHDARILATMIADPAQMKSGQIDVWARELDNYVLTDGSARWRSTMARRAARPPRPQPTSRKRMRTLLANADAKAARPAEL